MTTTSYINTFTNLVEGFIGAFPCDNIPTTNKRMKKYSIIVNLDTSQQAGSHWVALLVKNKTVYYYDPLGHKNNNEYITSYMNKFTIRLYNKQQIQSKLSDYCGLYCLAFIIHSNDCISPINKFNAMFCNTLPLLQFNDHIVVEYLINILSNS